jgi:putative two-component system response regulator
MTQRISGVGRVVVADDLAQSRGPMTELLEDDGHIVYSAPDGAAALELVLRERPDVVVSDVMMPNMNGFELCKAVKADRATRLIPVVLVTGATERQYRLRGIDSGADDFLIKPVDGEELKARVRSLIRLKRFTDELDSAESVILSLGVTVEARDGYTSGHCERMAAYAAAFGTHLGLAGDQVAALRRGGYLHDVGKIGIPDAILMKPGPLTDEEFAVMKRHPIIGESVCGDLRLLRPVRSIVRHHHERLDGSGYPDGLRGDDVPLLAQITGIVDVYDALTVNRPYRARVATDAAYAELRLEATRGWRSHELVESFVALAESGALAAAAARRASAPR